MAQVLVTGGTGTLGRRLVPLLVERGHRGTEPVATGQPRPAPVRRPSAGTFAPGRGWRPRSKASTPWFTPRPPLAGTCGPPRSRAPAGWWRRSVTVRSTWSTCRSSGWTATGFPTTGPSGRRSRSSSGRPGAGPSAGPPSSTTCSTGSSPAVPSSAHRNLAFQVIDPGEVADRLADHVEAGPAGRVPDIGGPEVVPIVELARIRREVRGRAAALLPVPAVGFLRDFDAGRHLCPEHRVGTLTWRQWLEDRRPVTDRAGDD